MNIRVRRKLEMAERVQEFSRAHPTTDPAHAPVLASLEEHLTRAVGIATRQRQGLAAARSARLRRRELRRVLQSQLLHYLVVVGEVAAKGQAELVARFRLPSGNASNKAFLADVRALVALAEAQRDALVAKGMSASLLPDLDRMIAEFETATTAALTGRRDHIGARADLEVVSDELMEQVRVLDGINRYRFGNDRNLMTEWNAVRQLAGGPKAHGTPPGAGGGGSVPPGQGGIAPAA
jgi:hypothetical protein